MSHQTRDITFGNYLFHFARGADVIQEAIAHEWAYNIQHSNPNSSDLSAQIRAYHIPIPIILIPTEPTAEPPIIAEPEQYTEWDRKAQETVEDNEPHRRLYILGEPTPPYPDEYTTTTGPPEPEFEAEWGNTPNTITIIPHVGGGGISFHRIFKQTALEGLVQDVGYEPVHRPQQNLTQFIDAIFVKVRPYLDAALNKVKGITFWVSVHVRYLNPTKPNPDNKPVYLHCGKRRIMNDFELDDILDDIRQAILIRNANFNRASSGLVLESILGFHMRICDFQPLRGGCRRELPTFLNRKHCIINVQNRDSRCFGFAVISALEEVAETHIGTLITNTSSTDMTLRTSNTQLQLQRSPKSKTRSKSTSMSSPSTMMKVERATPFTYPRKGTQNRSTCCFGTITTLG